MTVRGTVLAVLITTSFHTCTKRPDDGFISLDIRLDRDVHH